MLETALGYAARGWSVLPLHSIANGRCTCGRDNCSSAGKHPRTVHGVKDASCDPATIRAWDWNSANVGIATGAISSLVVIDIDPRHGGFQAALDLVPKHGEFPKTLEVKTGGGGFHLYFKHPGGRVANSSSKIGAGIDVRGDGGFVVAPPSLHTSGSRYQWRDISAELQPLPAWISGTQAERPAPVPPDAGAHWLAQALSRVTEGNRNDTGLWLACQLRDAGIDESQATLAMLKYAAACPAGANPYTPEEAMATCRSAYSAPPRGPARAKIQSVSQPPIAAQPKPICAGDLVVSYPELLPPVIQDLLRMCELMNIIGASKARKSWMVLCLALSVACGRPWLGRFPVEIGDVLLIDNELHPQTLARRLKTVAQAMGLSLADYADRLHVEPLRGRLQDLYSLGRYFEQIDAGSYRLIILDAFYRFLPAGTDENDNGAMANLYNVLDAHAQRLQCSFVLIHHASKGSQADKNVTDVGAGAGSMARATDTHLVIRPHEEENVVVLDCAARSWPPLKPLCLRWDFPLWHPDESLDPTLLQRSGRKRDRDQDAQPALTAAAFVAKYITAKPQDRRTIIARAGLDGISNRKSADLLALAVSDHLVHEWRSTARTEPVRYSNQPNPDETLFRVCAHTPHTPRECVDASRGRGKVARARRKRGES